MKKVHLISLFLVLVFASPVFAETSATSVSSTSSEVRNTSTTPGRGKQDEIKQQVEQKREVVKVQLTAKRQERVKNLFSNITRRLQAAVERLKKLGERINTRLTKLSQSGQDVSNYQQQLTGALSLLSQVEQKITGLNSTLESTLATQDPKGIYDGSLKLELESVKNDLKTVHQTFVQIITQIKGLRAPSGLPTQVPQE